MESLIGLLIGFPLLGAAVLLCGGSKLDRSGHWLGVLMVMGAVIGLFGS